MCAATMGIGPRGRGRIVNHGVAPHKTGACTLCRQTAAALTIELATRLGILSTTHTINTAIIGVGATRRLSAVRWGLTFEIVTAWILTFPICGAIGWLATKLFLLLS